MVLLIGKFFEYFERFSEHGIFMALCVFAKLSH